MATVQACFNQMEKSRRSQRPYRPFAVGRMGIPVTDRVIRNQSAGLRGIAPQHSRRVRLHRHAVRYIFGSLHSPIA
jgi:hypothetical protein